MTEIRGRGLLLGVALSIPAAGLSEALLERGVAAKETREHVLRIAPPLIVNDDEIAYLLERFAASAGQRAIPLLTLPRPGVIWLAGRSSGSFRSPDACGRSGLHLRGLRLVPAWGCSGSAFFIWR